MLTGATGAAESVRVEDVMEAVPMGVDPSVELPTSQYAEPSTVQALRTTPL